jgi:archaeal flagellin N-terminal-like domain
VRKAISPVIATVILIAVTLAIGIAIAAWLMGIWGGLGGTEALKVLPTSELIVTGDGSLSNLTLVIKNEGSKDAKLTAVQIEMGGGACKQNVDQVIRVGSQVNVNLEGSTFACTGLVPGATYMVKVVTEAGNVYQIPLVARVG